MTSLLELYQQLQSSDLGKTLFLPSAFLELSPSPHQIPNTFDIDVFEELPLPVSKGSLATYPSLARGKGAGMLKLADRNGTALNKWRSVVSEHRWPRTSR